MEILAHNIFVCLVSWDFWYMRAWPPWWGNVYLVILFSEITNQIGYLKWALATCKTDQLANLRSFREIKTFSSFLFRVLLHRCTIFCAPQKDICVWRMIEMCTNIFSVLNLTITCIKPFTCNNTIFQFPF